MAKTKYIFPTQEINGGSVDIVVYTSGGDGTPVTVTEKYFSSVKISESTEERGGQIKSYSADITVDVDKDNLFTGTFFPYLYETNGYVHLLIYIDGEIRFYGSVLPNSINLNTFYATNDDLENRQNSVTFKCGWILDLLRNVQMDTVYNSVLTNNLYESVTGEFSINTKFATLTNIVGRCIGLLNSTFGLNVLLNIRADETLYEFKSNDAVSGVANRYYFAFEGNRSPDSLGVAVGDASISGANKLGLVIQYASAVNPLFDPTSDKYIGSAYDFVVGLCKAFGLYPKASYDSLEVFDLIVDVSPRTAGAVPTTKY